MAPEHSWKWNKWQFLQLTLINLKSIHKTVAHSLQNYHHYYNSLKGNTYLQNLRKGYMGVFFFNFPYMSWWGNRHHITYHKILSQENLETVHAIHILLFIRKYSHHYYIVFPWISFAASTRYGCFILLS